VGGYGVRCTDDGEAECGSETACAVDDVGRLWGSDAQRKPVGG